MRPIQLIFEKQWLHALLLAALLAAMVIVSGFDGVRSGQLWGIATPVWLWIAVSIAVAHQIYVWLCWRAQLHASLLSRKLGNLGFSLYALGFSIFGVLRVVAVFMVAMSNQGTWAVNTDALKIIAIILLVPALYLFYSVGRYFGYRRAFGIDHFDSSYRSKTFERRGIFRFTSNGMYSFGFFLLWVPGFWWASLAGLSIALFNHLYVWVHYFATERPDMKRIYGES